MCLTCSLFLPIYVSHLVLCLSIDTPLEWFHPWPAFYHFLLYIHRFLAKSCIHTQVFGQKSRIHTGFWTKVMYTCRFLAKSCVHPLLFFKQFLTSSLFWLSLTWEVFGWVVSVAGSSWVLMLYVDYFFCDKRPLFYCFFFESTSSHLSPFLFFHLCISIFVSVFCLACV